MVHCPNVFPLARSRRGTRGRPTRVPRGPGRQFCAVVTPTSLRKRCAPGLPIVAPLDGHHDLTLWRCAKVGKDKYMGPQHVHATHFELDDL